MSDSVTPRTVARQAPLSWDSPGQNTGVDCHSLLQRIFLTQGSNPGPLLYRQIFYLLSYREELCVCIQLENIGWRGIISSLKYAKQTLLCNYIINKCSIVNFTMKEE